MSHSRSTVTAGLSSPQLSGSVVISFGSSKRPWSALVYSASTPVPMVMAKVLGSEVGCQHALRLFFSHIDEHRGEFTTYKLRINALARFVEKHNPVYHRRNDPAGQQAYFCESEYATRLRYIAGPSGYVSRTPGYKGPLSQSDHAMDRCGWKVVER